MEEDLAAFAGRASMSEDNHYTRGLDTPSKHTTLTKNIIRKKSVFTLAAEYFRANRAEKVEIPTPEHDKQERIRRPWNPFVSLRGFRDSRKRTTDFATVRCSSSSPHKNNESGIDEFGRQKAMRRKSLQDLLGTVGTKLSLAHRLVYSEDTIPQFEASPEALSEFQDISPLVLPEPALPLPGAPNALLGSLYLYSKEITSNEAMDSHSNLATHRDSEGTPSDRPKLQTNLSLGVLVAAGLSPNAVDRASITEIYRKPQETKHLSPSPSPARLCPAVPTDFLRDVSPLVPTHVRFEDEKDPPQYRYSDDFEDVIASENADLDPSFPIRALIREVKYNSINGGHRSQYTELSNKDIDKHVALAAAKMSKNLHLSTSQSRWSVDSSETDADVMSDYNWVEKEIEVHDIIDRGKEIMTLGTLSPYLHSSTIGQFCPSARSTDSALDKRIHTVSSEEMLCDEAPFPTRSGAPSPHESSLVSVERCPNSQEDWMSSASYVMRAIASEEPEPEPESLPSENLPVTNGMLRDLDEVTIRKHSCKANHGKKRVISLENGERFRPRRANSSLTKTYISKSTAFGDLYQNHSGFSDYCLFDRSTRTYYPQALSDPVPEFLQSNNKKLEVLWLPLEMFPADTLISQTDKEDDCPSIFNKHVSELDKPSISREVGVPNSNSDSVPASDVKDSETAAFNKVENTASSSGCNEGAYFEYGAWVGYTDSAPRADMVGVNHSNYTMTLISTREVSISTTGSLTSEDPHPDLDDVDDSYEIAIDSATARLYLGSLFSSTESLRSIGEAGVTRSNPVDSIRSKLKDSQLEKGKHVKTWIEMEREFLDKFAPRSQMSPSRRGRIAVYEAFKKLKGLADLSNDEDALKSDDSDSGFQDGPDTEQEKWGRYREAYMDFTFEHVEDTAKCGPIGQESKKTPNPSHVREGSYHSPCVDSDTIFDAKGKGKESVELPHRRHVEFATLRDHFRETPAEQQGADPELNTTMVVSTSHNSEEDGTEICRDSDNAALGSQSKLGNEEYSDTDNTAITMLSGYMFTHYAEQLGELPAEVHSEMHYHCEKECDGQSVISAFSDPPMDIISNCSMIGNACRPPSTELPEIDAGQWSDIDQLSVWPKDETIGLATAMTVQTCPPPTRAGLASPHSGRSKSLNPGCTTYPEALSGTSTSRPQQKLVGTPKRRIPSPLTELFSQRNQTVRGISPSASEADTEASENFGQNLQRYKRIEEEDKENEDLWWTDSISYG